jgi:NAD(P)-dependent dehydrogenase (short-subunit alcohol dehydrogenase family)
MQVTETAAIVTGGASGLGAATAKALASAGAAVYAFDLPAAISAAPTVEGVTYLEVDVTDTEQVIAAVQRAASGTLPLRTLVNSAGIAPSIRIVSKRRDHDLALAAKVIEVNLIGSFITMAAAAEHIAATDPLEDGQRGVVVNVASIAAFEGQVGLAAYAASKGGIVGLSLPAARDLAKYGIRVNAIAPGLVDTPMVGNVPDDLRAGLAATVQFPKRMGRPDEFADLAMFLISHDYINGEVVRMDGGLRPT